MKKKSWKELEVGSIDFGGNALAYHTGDWRTYRPVWSSEKCIQCLICWIYCPDSAIIVKDEKMEGIDLDYCKGCGICAKECPPKATAIEMKLESELRK
jgi:pyruvate ferredoxin oxidoreductase delta subunit